MRPLAILNPTSQGGKTGERATELTRVLARYLGEVDVVATTHGGHAGELAEAAAEEGRDVVVAIGGDGTIHEVADGLMRARDRGVTIPRLGIVGQGTGGDFRRTLGLEHRLDRYCQVIAEGKIRAVDVGRFGFRGHDGSERRAYFINILSVGLGGLVDRYITRSNRPLGGTVAYFNATLRALAKSEVGMLRCKVTYQGTSREVQLATRTLAVCNGRYFGGGMEVAPMAEPDDGVFHVVSLGDAPKVQFFLSSLSIYRGKHVDLPKTEIFPCESLEVDIENEHVRADFPLDVDGEPLGLLPLRIDVVPRALEVFVGSL